MSLGNFKETNEASEVNEARENTDNTEKPKNQILETPESYDDDFDSKLDTNENNNESKKDGQIGGDDSGGEKASLLDKMRNLFSKKESGEDLDSKVDGQTEQNNDGNDKRNSFLENLRKDSPSLEEQAQGAKELPGRDEYLDAREKSEQDKRDYPDLKDWELSPEQLTDVQKGQSEIGESAADIGKDAERSSHSEGRTPGGDAWERRFGNIEGED